MYWSAQTQDIHFVVSIVTRGKYLRSVIVFLENPFQITSAFAHHIVWEALWITTL